MGFLVWLVGFEEWGFGCVGCVGVWDFGCLLCVWVWDFGCLLVGVGLWVFAWCVGVDFGCLRCDLVFVLPFVSCHRWQHIPPKP